MQLPEIQMLFNEGILQGAFVSQIVENEYMLYFTRFGSKVGEDLIFLNKQRGGVRLFNSIDTAVNLAKSIGFNRVMVELSITY